MRQRTEVVAAIVVVAAFLVPQLVGGGEPIHGARVGSADARPGGGEPYVVTWLGAGRTKFDRVWSDGQVDEWEVEGGSCVFNFVKVVHPAVDHPFDVVEANDNSGGLVMKFADGRVDHIDKGIGGLRCTIAGEGSDPFCLGDIDRNGDTNFDDLLFVLRDWGVCEG